MGHLINSTAFRLGVSINWNDFWYSDLDYFSEYFFTIYKMRLFLSYIMSHRFFLRRSFFFSHFEFILFHRKRLLVYIYVYDGKAEDIFQNLLSGVRLGISKWKRRRFKNKLKKNIEFIKFIWLYYSIYGGWDKWFLSFKRRKKISKQRKKLFFKFFFKYLKVMKTFNFKRIKKFLKTKLFSRLYWNSNIFCFLYILLIHKYIIYRSRIGFVTYKMGFDNLLKQFFYGIFWDQRSHYFISSLRFLLRQLIKFSFLFQKNDVCFFSIGNNGVTSKFISRYIAKKLYQNYRLKDLINPIRRELAEVSADLGAGLTSLLRSKSVILLSKNIYNLTHYRIGLFHYFLFVLINYYNRNFFIFFKITSSFVFFDSILFFCKVFKLFNFFFKRIIWYSKKYSLKRFGFLLVYTQSYLLCDTIFGNLFGYSAKNYYELYRPNLLSLFQFSFVFCYVSYWNLIFGFANVAGQLNLSLGSAYFLNKFLKFSYYSYGNDWLFFGRNLNKMKLRSLRYQNYSYLLGFKIQCRGRFSRRQRASSIWYRSGYLPLNTVSAVIDYGYYYIPIKNSAICIKVWLYKRKNFNNDVYYFLGDPKFSFKKVNHETLASRIKI